MAVHESSDSSVKTGYAEVAELVARDHDFSRHAEGENTYFAFQTIRWLADAYEGYLKFSSDEFRGEEVPAALQPLLHNVWLGESYLTRDNTVNVDKRDEHDFVAPEIPLWDELNERLVVFDDIIAEIARRQEILAGIKPPLAYYTPKVDVFFEPHFSHGWGLQFCLGENRVEVHAFGKAGQTASASNFTLGYYNNSRVLAETAVNLALLAARHNHCNQQLSVEEMMTAEDQLMARLRGEVILEPAGEAPASPPGHSMKCLAISYLQELGVLPLPDHKSEP